LPLLEYWRATKTQKLASVTHDKPQVRIFLPCLFLKIVRRWLSQNKIYVPAGRLKVEAADLTTKAWTTLASAPARPGCPLVPAQLNGTPVLLRLGGSLFYQIGAYSPMPPISYHRFCILGITIITGGAWRIVMHLTRSTEVREREPYIGFVPFRIATIPALLYHGRSQSSWGR
jgi:hypothetical protein